MKALYLAAALATFSAPVMAQTTTSPAAISELTAKSFVKMAGVSNMFELQTSQLAIKKSKNGDLKTFASQMVKDHNKLRSELETLVTNGGAEKRQVPTRLDAEHAQKLKQLQSALGDDFDRSYKQMQVDAHQQAVSLFQSYSQQGDDAMLKAWAATTLPTLQQHLEQARNIQLTEQTGSLPQ
jgi:putative membrane protein